MGSGVALSQVQELIRENAARGRSETGLSSYSPRWDMPTMKERLLRPGILRRRRLAGGPPSRSATRSPAPTAPSRPSGRATEA